MFPIAYFLEAMYLNIHSLPRNITLFSSSTCVTFCRTIARFSAVLRGCVQTYGYVPVYTHTYIYAGRRNVTPTCART